MNLLPGNTYKGQIRVPANWITSPFTLMYRSNVVSLWAISVNTSTISKFLTDRKGSHHKEQQELAGLFCGSYLDQIVEHFI